MDRLARGQSTVEFGIASVVLLLILVGLLDLGRAFYYGVGMNGATREGARQASWFDASSGTNPYLYDAAIKSSVDTMLEKSGLPDSLLQNPGTTCPNPTDGNAFFNPPYSDSLYPTAADQPLLFICYNNSPGLDFTSAQPGNAYKGDDVNVILAMSFGFVAGFTTGALGNSVHMVANTHMTIGGY